MNSAHGLLVADYFLFARIRGLNRIARDAIRRIAVRRSGEALE